MPSTKKQPSPRKSKSAAKTNPRASTKTNPRASTKRAARFTTAKTPSKSTPPPPAYFLSLTLENVRCFGPRQTLDLSNGKGRPAQWTIILGDNGTGKTTLLESLVALTPVEDTVHYQISGNRIVAPKYINDPLFSFKWKPLRANRSSDSFHISGAFYSGSKLTDGSGGKTVSGFRVDKLEGMSGLEYSPAEREVLGEVTCFGYGASRRFGETTLAAKDDDIDAHFASLLSPEASLINPEEWLLQADYAASKSSSFQETARKRRDRIFEVLVKILPDVIDIKILQPSESLFAPTVIFKTPYAWVPIGSLSLGYKTLIAWMVDFASRMFERYPESEDPLAEPAVVLVDEIDLHLHPRWQRELVSFLSELFPNTQFIATTHSPLVVQAATDANLVVLRREGDHVVIDNEVVSVDGWRVDQILTGEPFGLESARPPQLDAMLAARREILSKPKMTPQDRSRLRSIESEIGVLPAGETPEEMRALDIISRAAARLRGKD